MKRICLNMIVKNESEIIEKTLRNILEKIPVDHWVICDTGSTDSTPTIIENFFRERGIEGEIYHDKWVDFSHNRNLALERAKNKAEYVFIFDADDSIVGDPVIPNELNSDYYFFDFGTYMRPLMVKSSVPCKWHGVLHEYLSYSNQPRHNISGNYHIVSGRTGSRNKNPNKYLHDAKVLERGYYAELKKENSMSARYSFYCAQSYKDCGRKKDALKWYMNTTKMNGWIEEKYYSYYQAGLICLSTGQVEKALVCFLDGQGMYDGRSECFYMLSKHYREKNNHKLAYLFAKEAKKISRPIDGLFIEQDVYDYLIDFELSISAYYCGEMGEGKRACERVIANSKDENIRNIATNNMKFYE